MRVGGPGTFFASSADFTVEVLKSGTIVETKELSLQGHYTFGRNPACDFVLEHPSASRLHAVGATTHSEQPACRALCTLPEKGVAAL